MYLKNTPIILELFNTIMLFSLQFDKHCSGAFIFPKIVPDATPKML